MAVQTPITLITGPLGSGKTTLLQGLLTQSSRRLAVIINEFGELNIDGRLIQGRDVRITELSGGCVCCSLLGEFEAAVQEIIELASPEAIVVETTGVAEPEALLFDVADTLPQSRIDGVITIMDGDAMVSFPDLGMTSRMQVEAADLILLNKIDLITAEQQTRLQVHLRALNPRAPIIPTRYCRVDNHLLFGMTRSQPVQTPSSIHQPHYEALTFRSSYPLQRQCFEESIAKLDPAVYRAKGFVRFTEGSYLFNYVNGRWSLDALPENETALVFIGQAMQSKAIMELLRECEIK